MRSQVAGGGTVEPVTTRAGLRDLGRPELVLVRPAPATPAAGGAAPARRADASSMFQESFWLDAVAPGSWEDVTVEHADGSVAARLPFRIWRRHRLTILGNPLLTPYIGPFVDHAPNTSASTRVSRELRLVAELTDRLPHHDVAHFQLAPSFAGWLGLQWAGFRLRPSVTYGLALDRPVDELWAGLRGDLRRDIRNAERHVTIDDGLDPDVVAAEYLGRLDAKGVRHSFDRPLFERVARALEDHGRQVWTLTARDRRGQIRGAALFGGDERCIYYLAGGVRPGGEAGSVGGLLIWTGVRMAAGRTARFDFEGSNVAGLERLFREFGAEPEVVIRGIRMAGRLGWCESLLRHPLLR